MEILFISLLTLVASFVWTITWFGTSTIMIPVLVMFMAPIDAMFLVWIIHWFGNLWKIIFFRNWFDKKLVLLFWIVWIFFSYLWAHFSIMIDRELFLRILWWFFVLYSIYFIFEKKIKINPNNSIAILWWSLSWFFAWLFWVWWAIRWMFLLSFNLPKEVYIATAWIIGLLIDSSRIITYYLEWTKLDNKMSYSLILFIAISFIWAYISKKYITRISQDKFRLIVVIFLLIIWIKMIFYPL